MSPIFEYRCRGCQAVTDATRPISNRRDPVACPRCGDDADLIMSQVAFPNSKKAWSGRKQVNFETDDRQEIAKKQAALMANSGRIDGFFEKTKRTRAARKGYLDAIEKMIKKADIA